MMKQRVKKTGKVLAGGIPLLLLSLAASGAFAQSRSLSAGADISLSPSGFVYVNPTLALVNQPGLFGGGVEVKAPYSVVRGDLYLVALALLKVGWFDLGVGFSTMLVPPSTTGPSLLYPNDAILFASRFGLTVPGWDAGPGELGFSVSLDNIVTAGTTLMLDAPTDIGEWILWLIFSPLFLFIERLEQTKLSIGVRYSFGY